MKVTDENGKVYELTEVAPSYKVGDAVICGEDKAYILKIDDPPKDDEPYLLVGRDGDYWASKSELTPDPSRPPLEFIFK